MDAKEIEKRKAQEIEKLDKKYYRLLWGQLIWNILFAAWMLFAREFPESRLMQLINGKKEWLGIGLVITMIVLLAFLVWNLSIYSVDKRLRQVIEKNELYKMYTLKSIRWGYLATGISLLLWWYLIKMWDVSIPTAAGLWCVIWLGIIAQNIANLVYRSRK